MYNSEASKQFQFDDNYQVICIYGYHQLWAAQSILPSEDQQQVVELYDRGRQLLIFVGHRLKCLDLIEAEISTLKYKLIGETLLSTREIFRHHRFCNRSGDLVGASQWLGRLPPSIHRDLKQITQSAPLQNSFEKLVDFPTLWNNVRLGSLHRVLSIHCEEVSLYMSRLYKEYLLNNTIRKLQNISSIYIRSRTKSPMIIMTNWIPRLWVIQSSAVQLYLGQIRCILLDCIVGANYSSSLYQKPIIHFT